MMRKALELDPLSPIINEDFGDASYYARRYREAVEQYERTLSLFPGRETTHAMLGFAYLKLERYADARAEFLRLMDQRPGLPLSMAAAITAAYSASGFADSAAAIIDRSSDWTLSARVYAFGGLKDADRTLAALDSAVDQHAPWATTTIANPLFDFLRSDPRSRNLRRRMGLER